MKGTVVLAALWGDFEIGIGLGKELSLNAAAAGDVARSARPRAAARRAPRGRRRLASKRYVALVIDDALPGSARRKSCCSA